MKSAISLVVIGVILTLVIMWLIRKWQTKQLTSAIRFSDGENPYHNETPETGKQRVGSSDRPSDSRFWFGKNLPSEYADPTVIDHLSFNGQLHLRCRSCGEYIWGDITFTKVMLQSKQ